MRTKIKEPAYEDKNGQCCASIVEITVDGPGGSRTSDRVLSFSKPNDSLLSGLVRFEFRAMDHWLEEDTPIYVHPKDPFKRIDILTSTRDVEVKVRGVTIAKSRTAIHLFETGLPTRYYIPLMSVKQEYLRPSDLVTKCPYKGDAEYYHVEVADKGRVDNVIWYYRLPTNESAAIAGLLCFYNEKVDIFLDGKQLERPKTHFA